MKIGFVLYDYYSFGGLQEDCLATAVATAERGHEVSVFTRTWTGDCPANVSQQLLGKVGWSNISRNDHFFRTLEQELPRHNLDGVVAFSRIPSADVYFAADPCYLERVKNNSFLYKLKLRHRYYKALEKTVFTAPNPPYTLVLTDKEIDAFHQHYGIDQSKFHLLPPGVAKKRPATSSCRSRKPDSATRPNSVAQTMPSSHCSSALATASKDSTVRSAPSQPIRPPRKTLEFWIVGNGKQNRFASLAKQAGVTVRFLGGRADVDRFYDAADFLLHPAYSESAGKVLLEALTHGLPVLTTDTCGYAPHILKASAGAVIESPFSQDTLNQTVKEFIQNADKRQAMRENALAYAAAEDLYSCHQAAAEIIENILSKKT